jgi:two-component system, OmpR family, KDP operon response regulator KdpE
MADRPLTQALVVHKQHNSALRPIKVALEANGYHLTLAQGEANGLRSFFAVRPAVVILVLSAEWNGESFMQDIRLCCDVPILLLAAPSMHPVVEQSDCTALRWPAAPAELLATLEGLLSSVTMRAEDASGRATKRAQPGGELILDPDQRQLLVRGSFVKLTPQEYDLLAYLMRTPGRVVGVNQILEHVWGSCHKGHDDYVHTYVWRLRHKIELDPIHPRHLLNEYGDGFYLAAV